MFSVLNEAGSSWFMMKAIVRLRLYVFDLALIQC
jgi:hypothetical protein